MLRKRPVILLKTVSLPPHEARDLQHCMNRKFIKVDISVVTFSSPRSNVHDEQTCFFIGLVTSVSTGAANRLKGS